MSDDAQPKPVKANSLTRRVTIYAVLLLVGFLLGFVPMWLKYRESSASLSAAEEQLNPARRQNTLASAVIDARRGDYEPARQAASDFFNSLRAETDRGNASALSQAQREGVQALFKQRDEIITLLARGDPAAADRLSDLYVSYRKIMKEGGTSVQQKS
jgi:biopolymer transport protein ExbB/TolQ